MRGNPFRGSQDSIEPWSAVVQQLQRLDRLAGLVIYGSPYVWEQLKTVLNHDIPAAYSPGQMPEAQRQVLTTLLNRSHTTTGNADFTD
jgi:beta-glucosidase